MHVLPRLRVRDTLKGDTKKTELEKDEGGVKVDDTICSVICSDIQLFNRLL